jgi:hypothetical protein
MRYRPGRGLARENMLVIGRRLTAKPKPKPEPKHAAPEPKTAPRPLASDAWRADRIAESVRATQNYHAAPEAIGAGRI